MSQKLKWMLLIPLMTLFSACSTAPPDTINACNRLHLRQYSAEEQKAVALEMQAKVAPHLAQQEVDHIALRDEVKACQSTGKRPHLFSFFSLEDAGT